MADAAFIFLNILTVITAVLATVMGALQWFRLNRDKEVHRLEGELAELEIELAKARERQKKLNELVNKPEVKRKTAGAKMRRRRTRAV